MYEEVIDNISNLLYDILSIINICLFAFTNSFTYIYCLIYVKNMVANSIKEMTAFILQLFANLGIFTGSLFSILYLIDIK